MLNENSPQFVDLIMANTAFDTEERANSVIETLKWLDQGAPEQFDGLPGKYQFEMTCFVEDLADLDTDDDIPLERGCGTACCIAGAIIAFEKKGITDFDSIKSIPFYFMRNRSDQQSEDLHNLFMCTNSPLHLQEVTAKGAAKTLRRYIESGKVTWVREEQV